MVKLKYPLITVAGTSLGIIVYLGIKNTLTIRSLSDTFFIVSLFFLIIGSALWIMSSGFFDNFQRSMKNTWRRKKKNGTKEFVPLSESGKKYLRYWVETGGLLLIVALVFYYFTFYKHI